jgi:hypothetical protein
MSFWLAHARENIGDGHACDLAGELQHPQFIGERYQWIE